MYHAAYKVALQSFNRSYSQLTFFYFLIETACASECNNCCPHKPSFLLKRLFVGLHVRPAQLLYIASEIAFALLAHAVAAAGLRGDFSERQKCSVRMRKACSDQQGRGVTYLVRISRVFCLFILIMRLRLLVLLLCCCCCCCQG